MSVDVTQQPAPRLTLTINPHPRLALTQSTSSTVVMRQSTSSTVVMRQSTTQASVIIRGPGRGPAGIAGSAASITIGTVTTGAAGSSASVSNAGSSSAAVLNFTIPRGDTGQAGPQGPVGPGLSFQGTVATVGNLPGSATVGHAYIVQADNHAHVWNGSAWIDIGTVTVSQGVPAGGTTGQILAKSSDTDYATQWIAPPAGSLAGLTDVQLGTPTNGQALVYDSSTGRWKPGDITPTATLVNTLSWDSTSDTYPTALTDLSIQSRMRRCLLRLRSGYADDGTVNYYLDADNSTYKAGDWLRIVETQTISTPYTGTISESANSTLRRGVNAWTPGVYTAGQRVTHNGKLWECLVASTSATPASGSVPSKLDGTDGQVMVEIPLFSYFYSYTNGVHAWNLVLGVKTADDYQVHPAFIRANGSYRSKLYIGAYQVTGTDPLSTVSGVPNKVDMTRATHRAAAASGRIGWHQWSHYDLAAVQLLLICEFGSVNSQKVLGNGAQTGGVYSVNTGLSDSAGNRSQNVHTAAGSVGDFVSYRGLENLYGRAWQWTDGINVRYGEVYATNIYANFADDTITGYSAIGEIPRSVWDVYQTNFLPAGSLLLPSAASNGSATSKIGDALWTGADLAAICVGGAAYSAFGPRNGVFTLDAYSDSRYHYIDVSSRLAYGKE